jgi:hypothetical protein
MSLQTPLGPVMEFARRSQQKIWTWPALPWSLFPSSQQMIKSSAAWTCLEVWEKANEDPAFISGIKVGDERRIYGHDPETKQSSQWKSPQSPRAKHVQQIRSLAKSMLFFFFVEGIVHHEFVSPNTVVNSDIYCNVLRCLRENVWWKRPELWRNHS